MTAAELARLLNGETLEFQANGATVHVVPVVLESWGGRRRLVGADIYRGHFIEFVSRLELNEYQPPETG